MLKWELRKTPANKARWSLISLSLINIPSAGVIFFPAMLLYVNEILPCDLQSSSTQLCASFFNMVLWLATIMLSHVVFTHNINAIIFSKKKKVMLWILEFHKTTDFDQYLEWDSRIKQSLNTTMRIIGTTALATPTSVPSTWKSLAAEHYCDQCPE